MLFCFPCSCFSGQPAVLCGKHELGIEIRERLYDINPGFTLICESVDKVIVSCYRDDFSDEKFP